MKRKKQNIKRTIQKKVELLKTKQRKDLKFNDKISVNEMKKKKRESIKINDNKTIKTKKNSHDNEIIINPNKKKENITINNNGVIKFKKETIKDEKIINKKVKEKHVKVNDTPIIRKQSNVNDRNKIRVFGSSIQDLFNLPDSYNNIETLEILLDKLINNDFFSYLRFGDADYLMMMNHNLNKIIGGSNKFFNNKNLRNEIIEAHNIVNNDYLIGSILNPKLENLLHSYIPFLKSQVYNINNLQIQKDNLLSAVSLTESFISNNMVFFQFIKELRKSKTMFVGSYYHNNLDIFYGKIKYYIKTPPINSYSVIDDLMVEILNNIDNVDKVIFSCGQTSRIIIKRLWIKNIKKILIDVGSLSDYWVLNTYLENEIKLRGHIISNLKLIKKNQENLLKKLKYE